MSIKGGYDMTHLYGLKNIQVYATKDIDELNQFLLEYNGDIIDIQCTDEWYHVIYKYREG